MSKSRLDEFDRYWQYYVTALDRDKNITHEILVRVGSGRDPVSLPAGLVPRISPLLKEMIRAEAEALRAELAQAAVVEMEHALLLVKSSVLTTGKKDAEGNVEEEERVV